IYRNTHKKRVRHRLMTHPHLTIERKAYLYIVSTICFKLSFFNFCFDCQHVTFDLISQQSVNNVANKEEKLWWLYFLIQKGLETKIG
ncbi:hypothetical protein DW026_11465, partial [Segatella copri]